MKTNLFLALALVFALISCATVGDIEKLPRRQIDRPYTLPSGLDSWGMVSLLTGTEYSTGQKYGTAVVAPFWQQSLSDKVSLLWVPLPLGLRVEAYRNESHRLGFDITLGFGSSSLYGSVFYPSLGLEYLYKFDSNWALVTEGNYNPEFRSRDSATFYNRNLHIGLVKQFESFWALKFLVGAGVDATSLDTLDYFSLLRREVPYSSAILGTSISLSKQWDLFVQLTGRRGTNENDKYSQSRLMLGFMNFW